MDIYFYLWSPFENCYFSIFEIEKSNNIFSHLGLKRNKFNNYIVKFAFLKNKILQSRDFNDFRTLKRFKIDLYKRNLQFLAKKCLQSH